MKTQDELREQKEQLKTKRRKEQEENVKRKEREKERKEREETVIHGAMMCGASPALDAERRQRPQFHQQSLQYEYCAVAVALLATQSTTDCHINDILIVAV